MLDYLFVYGTLRRETESEMYHLLARCAVFVGKATYQGRLYRIDDYPGAIPADEPTQQVKGEVYSLHRPAKVLSTLDQYEGCGPRATQPTEYLRVKQEVVLGTGQKLPAWVYLYNRPTDGLPVIASGDFLGDRG